MEGRWECNNQKPQSITSTNRTRKPLRLETTERVLNRYMSLVMRKPAFAYAKTKTQISCAILIAQLISAFVFATQIVQSLYYLNPKLQVIIAIFRGCTARFVSDLVGNPEDRFSHNEAHIKKKSARDLLPS